MSHLINNWDPEVRSLFVALIAAGFIITEVDNGEDKTKSPDLDEAVKQAIACDIATVYVSHPDNRKRIIWIYIVLGNEPGELCSDYCCDSKLDEVISKHSDEWELKGQAKMKAPEPGWKNKF